MSKLSNLGLPANWTREPRYYTRVILGVLLFANLMAVWMVLSPVGGSVEQLEQQIGSLRDQIQQRKTAIGRLKNITSRVDTARVATDQFFTSYFMDRRTAASTIVSELATLSKEAGLKPLEHSFTFDQVEGSDDIEMMSIVGNYEGTYGDLLQYLNRLDKSRRFLIVDSLVATPVQGTGNLRMSLRMNSFVRDYDRAADAVLQKTALNQGARP